MIPNNLRNSAKRLLSPSNSGSAGKLFAKSVCVAASGAKVDKEQRSGRLRYSITLIWDGKTAVKQSKQ